VTYVDGIVAASRADAIPSSRAPLRSDKAFAIGYRIVS
jgi:hypothetical protein